MAWAAEPVSAPVCPQGTSFVEREGGLVSGCERKLPDKAAVRVGKWTWRNGAGELLFEATYGEDGREQGPAVQYGPGGTPIETRAYEQGRLEGEQTRWWPASGHLREQATYHAGRLHGVRKRWEYDARRRPDCSEELELCWVGTEECWVQGERRPHEACNAIYASSSALKPGRGPASAAP